MESPDNGSKTGLNVGLKVGLKAGLKAGSKEGGDSDLLRESKQPDGQVKSLHGKIRHFLIRFTMFTMTSK